MYFSLMWPRNPTITDRTQTATGHARFRSVHNLIDDEPDDISTPLHIAAISTPPTGGAI